MRIELISFTKRGALLARRLADGLAPLGHSCAAYGMPRHAVQADIRPLELSLAQWTERAFSRADALVFVSACGVAVRAVAPLLRGKTEDPAVVVLDDGGRFAVSLLSGHIGGANALTLAVAGLAGAQPVVSTATDGAGVFAVDSWATGANCALWELPAAKAVSAALLDGESVGFCSDFPVDGPLPEGLEARDTGALGICVTLDEAKTPFSTTLHLVPRVLALGIGCKRGSGAEHIAACVREALAERHISLRAVCGVASVDLKADEPGLLAFCAEHGWSLSTYSSHALMQAPGVFSASEFVRKTTGADNVCERAAVLLAGPGGTLALQKQAGSGVTVAAAVHDWRVRF